MLTIEFRMKKCPTTTIVAQHITLKDPKMQREKRCLLGLLVVATIALPSSVLARDIFPSKPVKILVGFPAGSSTDVAARVLAQRLGQTLGQQFIVDNRAGASSNIAARSVATAAPDGYTLFVGTIANTINVSLQPGVSVDLAKEFVPVSMIGSVPNLLVVHPSLGVATMEQLLVKAKAEPGRITYASSGNGTSPHLSGELFNYMAGVRMLHVPYKGSSPAVVDLLAGQVVTMFAPASSVLPHIRSGKLKAIATTGSKRSESLPDLPTVEELGLKGFETSVWFGLNAPVGTPQEVVDRLNVAVQAAQDHAELKLQFKNQGIDIVRANPSEFSTLIDNETNKWARLIKSAGIQPQ
jgi:tripartite-type tricarboxylate transporter receptor subunit TctC